ncbi:hypothetical protein KJ611_04345, partial [Patescibacteria group bacterium]|nr:hypothetical protein [Patescibacteria group bacterium]
QGYEARKYRNPYFAAKKKTTHWIKTAVIILVAAALITWLMNFLLRSPIYAINQVQISGTETIKPDELIKLANDYLDQPRFIFSHQRNRFLFDQNGLAGKLSENYSFERLDLQIAQNSLVIELKEKTSQLLWISQEKIYLVDLNGAVIRELNPEELAILNEPWPPPADPAGAGEAVPSAYLPPLKTLPKFRDLNDLPAKPGLQVLTAEEINNIFRFHERLKTMQIGFFETRIDRLAGKWMSVLAEKGYDILFDATGDINQQAKNLEVILRESIGERDDIQYIDLRFGDHVYYK